MFDTFYFHQIMSKIVLKPIIKYSTFSQQQILNVWVTVGLK